MKLKSGAAGAVSCFCLCQVHRVARWPLAPSKRSTARYVGPAPISVLVHLLSWICWIAQPPPPKDIGVTPGSVSAMRRNLVGCSPH